MLHSIGILAAALVAGAPAHAEIFNLSCDDGGMLLTIDTGRATITDRNPFQRTQVTAPLTIGTNSYAWHEGPRGAGADYRLDRASGLVRAAAQGKAVALANPQCGKSAILRRKQVSSVPRGDRHE